MNDLDDSENTDRCKLYEDSANFLKDERFTKTEYQTSANLLHRTPNDAQHTQHKLGVAFSYLERKN